MKEALSLEVTDIDILKIQSLRKLKKELSHKLKQVEAELNESENSVISNIEGGCRVNSHFSISIELKFKTYPRYKEEIEARLGSGTLKEIIESTPKREYKRLIIK